MRFFFAAAILVLICGNAGAQSTCKLPEVRGLAVGMTTAEIRQHYPKFTMPKADRYGYAEIRRDFTLERGRYESYSSDPVKVVDPLEGMDVSGLAGFDIAFLDERLVTLVVSYKTEWSGVNEFVQALSAPLMLPAPKDWSKVDAGTLQIQCQKGAIKATVRTSRGGGTVTIGEIGIKAELLKRKKDEEERQRKGFQTLKTPRLPSNLYKTICKSGENLCAVSSFDLQTLSLSKHHPKSRIHG